MQKHTAEREIFRLSGLKRVINDIEVKSSRTPGSAKFKAGMEGALKPSAEGEARRLHVGKRGNIVVLTGAASSWPERNPAERAGWSARGVSNIENNLTISAAMLTTG